MTHQDLAHAEPAYLTLPVGEMARRAEAARAALADCVLCPWHCHVDRLAGRRGVCRTGADAVVAAYHPHHGEEAPLRGTRGSGTIFFAWCNLRCAFCQNWEISQAGEGKAVTAEGLAEMMLRLQRRGCHNINLVSPSHVIAQILQAVALAAEAGLRLPLVYNTAGYDDADALRLLNGVVDIYMPDMKYADPDVARRLSRVKDYPRRNQEAVLEMQRQVGDLVIGEDGLARRGLLVRHLILPDGLAGTRQIAHFLATRVSRNTYINLMDQYHPDYQADRYPPLDRRPTRAEVRAAYEDARAEGLWRFHEE